MAVRAIGKVLRSLGNFLDPRQEGGHGQPVTINVYTNRTQRDPGFLESGRKKGAIQKDGIPAKRRHVSPHRSPVKKRRGCSHKSPVKRRRRSSHKSPVMRRRGCSHKSPVKKRRGCSHKSPVKKRRGCSHKSPVKKRRGCSHKSPVKKRRGCSHKSPVKKRRGCSHKSPVKRRRIKSNDNKVIKKLLNLVKKKKQNPSNLRRRVMAVITVPQKKFIVKLRYMGHTATGVGKTEKSAEQKAADTLIKILRHL